MQNLYVIDNFYKDPNRVRELALSLDYETNSTPNYPGPQSVLPVMSDSLAKKLSDTVGCEIEWSWSEKQMGFFRYILADGKSRLKVHTDMNDWTVVIYLSPHCPKHIGTKFYRHRATGLLGPPNAEEQSKFGFTSFADYEKKLLVPDTLNDTAWDVVDEVEYVYNRCIIFRADTQFHSHSDGWGTDRESARLTQNFFFNVKRKV